MSGSDPDRSPAGIRRQLKKLEGWREGVLLPALRDGTFDYVSLFPESKRASRFERPDHARTIGEFLDEVRELKRVKLSENSTFADYTNTIELLRREFGDKRAIDVRKSDVSDWVHKYGFRTKKRARNVLNILRQAFDQAILADIITINPAQEVTLNMPEPFKDGDHAKPLTVKEEVKLMAALKKRFGDPILPVFQFWLWTGLRTSELVALQWGDVLLEPIETQGVLFVRRGKAQRAKACHKLKTANGRRRIRLAPRAIAALVAQRKYTDSTDPNAFIFCDPRHGTPWTGDQALRKSFWRPAIALAGIPYRTPYQCRHTVASRLLTAGEDLFYVKTAMGHATIAQTQYNYARWIDGEADGRKFVELWESRLTEAEAAFDTETAGLGTME